MDLTTTLEVAGIIGGIATWLALSLGPMFYLGSKMDALRSDINSVRTDLASFKTEMYQESKDFHGRLISIEEKRTKILEK